MSPLRRSLNRFGDHALYAALRLLAICCAILRVRSIHHAAVMRTIARRGLFDPAFYLFQHEDVETSGHVPLAHYVRYGDNEGRWPMPLFDPVFYAEQSGLDADFRGNRLLHYCCIGRHKGYSPSPWFDLKYYRSRNKDVVRSGMDPLRHFMRWGGREGRSPSPRFDAAYYLSTTPEVTEWGMNPLLHYLQHGQHEGRRTVPGGEGLDTQPHCIPQPTRPSPEEWAQVRPRVADGAQVDVIVPVYSGTAVTLRCLQRLLSASQTTPFEVILIDDASPEPELVSFLDELAERGLLQLIRNAQNLGFVQSANAGMRLHPDRDVVLLNSDTEVFGTWLDRLRAAIQQDRSIATATPLSNNATICSYPNVLEDNPYPLEISYEELDRLTQEVNRGKAVETPTGVGFCLYVRRACLDQVGFFDDQLFGRGYGEENDLCQRAIQHGWKNVVVADVFVRHWGAASFQGERSFRVRNAMETMRTKYPHYLKEIKRFISQDPLSRARERLDLARLMRLKQAENVLLVIHARGGGTERHVGEDIARLRAEGKGVFLLRPQPDGRHVALSHPDVFSLPNLKPATISDTGILAALFVNLGITELHLHHLIDFGRDAPIDLLRLVRHMGVKFRVMLHDYTPICPRVNLVDSGGVYCGEPSESICKSCITRNGTDFGKVDIRSWRAAYGALLRAANEVLVPDRDVAQRLHRYFPDVQFQVQPHESSMTSVPDTAALAERGDGRLRIAVIGAISKIKGYDVLLACARDARRRDLPLDFVVLGYTLNDRPLEREGVSITGRYLDSVADEQLKALRPDCVWLPYVWPETYSYTLSIALRAGLPVFAFDLGAIASRLKDLGVDRHLMPLRMVWSPQIINDRFLENYRVLYMADGNEQCASPTDWPETVVEAAMPVPAWPPRSFGGVTSETETRTQSEGVASR